MTNADQSISENQAERARIPPFAFVLTACIGVIGSNSLALGPIAPEVARSLGADVPSVMTASATFGLGTAASAIFLGRLIDRYGARRMLALALLLFAAGIGVSAAAPALSVLITAQLLVGIAGGIVRPLRLATWMADKQPVWDAIVRRHGLVETRLADVADWAFADFFWSHGYDIISSTTRLRQAGFHDILDTAEMVLGHLIRYREAKILP